MFDAAAATAPHMSATALLQKAAQIGLTSSSAANHVSATSFFSHTTTSSSTTNGLAVAVAVAVAVAAGGNDLASSEYHQFENCAYITSGFVTGHGLASYGDNNNKAGTFHFGASVTPGFMEQVHDMHNMMATTVSLPCTNFHEEFGGSHLIRGKEGGGNNEGLTRDFLGLRAFPHHRDFLNTTAAAGLHQMGSSSSFDHHPQNQNQSPWKIDSISTSN